MAGDYNIGLFTELVVFERPTNSVSAVGERVKSWEKIDERFCQVVDAVDEDKEQQEALAADESYLVKTWAVDGLTTECRAVYDGKNYSITKIQRQERGIVFVTIKKTDLCE